VVMMELKDRATAQALASEVRSGASFAAKGFHEWLEHPDFANIALEKRIFDRVVFRAPPHVFVGPLHIDGQYTLLEVTSAVPPRRQSLSEVRGRIEKELSSARRVRFVTAWRRKWTGRTSCISAYVVQKCVQYRGPITVEDPLDVN
jgi:hypothetical protein